MAELPTEQRLQAGFVAGVGQKIMAGSALALLRARNLPATLRSNWPSAEPMVAASGGSGGGAFRKSFLLLVIAPTLLFGLYTSLWESSGYVAEARVTVRAAQEQRGGIADAASLIGKLTGGSRSSQQDSYIVLNYIKSQAIIVDLGGRNYLEKIFGNSKIDYFSRLKTDETIEDLAKYWTRRVVASVDTLSGILTVRVTAFNPEDALKVTQDIVQLSEKLVNVISMRNRQDALDRAEAEVRRSAQKLAAAREALLQFRNLNALIDPASRAASIGEMVAKLTMEKIDIESSLKVLSESLSSDSPSQRLQRSKLDTLNQQIDTLKGGLTSMKGDDNVAAELATYERLKLDEQFVEKIYTISQNAFFRARQEMDKQQLYLVTVVTPTLPESATYPKIVASTLLLFASLFILWSIGALIAASINDHNE